MQGWGGQGRELAGGHGNLVRCTTVVGEYLCYSISIIVSLYGNYVAAKNFIGLGRLYGRTIIIVAYICACRGWIGRK